MALYELKDATLSGIDGEGYVYPVETYKGIGYKGVFFAGGDADLASVADQEGPTFAGTVYMKSRTKNGQEVTVDVTNVVSVGVGVRADFTVVDES